MRPREILKEEDLLLQLAEEAAELSQAAAKLARDMIGRNPTCRTREELVADLVEELTDVMVVSHELPYRPDKKLGEAKRIRWGNRLEWKQAEVNIIDLDAEVPDR